MKKKSNYSRGGGVLLKKHGLDYFKKLRAKQTRKQRKAMKLWNKTQNNQSNTQTATKKQKKPVSIVVGQAK